MHDDILKLSRGFGKEGHVKNLTKFSYLTQLTEMNTYLIYTQ